MSFSHDTKAELCRLPLGSKCCSVAECYGMLLYCNTFSAKEIKIITGNRQLKQRISAQFRRAFSVTFDVMPEDSGQDRKQTLIISKEEKLGRVFNAFGISGDSMVAHHVNLGVLEEDCCKQSFIRGAFFTGGAITNPEKSYHFELVTDHYSVSRETYSLLLEMGFSPKEASRGGNYITYFKQSAAIEDLLTLIGAPLAAMELMSAKIEKDMRNGVNRRVNCDTANVSKTVDAAGAQIDAINKLSAGAGLASLPEKLRETARIRLENPELSIVELAALFSPPVTKSCLNHRLRKLVQLAGQGTD